MDEETPPAEKPPRLYREPEDKKIAGVCQGLADHFGLDPRLVRIAVIVFALSKGMGIVAYMIAVVVLPERPADVPRRRVPAEPLTPSTSNVLIVALALIAALIVGDGGLWWFEGPTVGLLLVGVGVWLLVSEREKSSVFTTPSVRRTTLTGEAASQSNTSGGNDPRTTLPRSEPDDSAGPRGEVPPPVPPWGPPSFPASSTAVLPQPTRSVEPEPRSVLSAVVGGLLLAGVGLCVLLQVLDVIHPSPAQQLGAILLVVGTGLFVGSWLGRARPLLAVGLPVLGVLLAGESVRLPLSAGAGDRTIEVTSLAELRALDTEHELMAGQLVLDLSEAPLSGVDGEPLDLTATVGFGELRVILPAGGDVEVKADVDIGELRWDQQSEGGVNVERELEYGGAGSSDTILLDLHVGIGELDVRQENGEARG